MKANLLISSLLLVLGSGFCEESSNDVPAVDIKSHAETEDSLLRSLRSKCDSHSPAPCLALELTGYVDSLLKTAALQLSDNVVLLDERKNIVPKICYDGLPIETFSDGEGAGMPISPVTLARAGNTIEEHAQQLITEKLWTFARTRSLRWRLMDDADLVLGAVPDEDGSLSVGMSVKDARSIEKGRGKYKNLGPILAAAAMKIGLLGGLAFKGLALLVGKALLISKVALLLASIIGLKKLFSHQKHVTYEVVAHPHHHESGHESGEDWGREAGDAQNMAYSAQEPRNY